MTPVHWTADHFVPLLLPTDPDQEVLVTDDEDNAPPLLPDTPTKKMSFTLCLVGSAVDC